MIQQQHQQEVIYLLREVLWEERVILIMVILVVVEIALKDIQMYIELINQMIQQQQHQKVI